MILLDTNVLVYASDPASSFHDWATDLIVKHVAGDGAMINPVILAEICVGDSRPEQAAAVIQSWGIAIVDLPVACAEPSARAYRAYREARKKKAESPLPAVPLPDFWIGAHAALLRIPLATADVGRYHTYFPKLKLLTPRR